jgi:hypothetical protein
MGAPTISKTFVSNLALAELPQGAIASYEDENSQAARQCRTHYDQCVQELLEDHPWTFALGRVLLAQVTNDRPVWGYAYTVPQDAAYIGKVFGPEGQGLDDINNPIPGTRFANVSIPGMVLNTDDRDPRWPFELGQDGAVLYTDCENAAVEYTKKAISEAVFRPMFTRALAVLLASRG